MISSAGIASKGMNQATSVTHASPSMNSSGRGASGYKKKRGIRRQKGVMPSSPARRTMVSDISSLRLEPERYLRPLPGTLASALTA